MLVQFASKLSDGTYPLGSYCLLAHKEYNNDTREMVMINEYHGLVIREYEKNYYDDSDFVAVVWDVVNQAPKHITFATTRGWSYPCGCVVDATPEVLALYEAYCAKQKRIWDEYNVKVSAYIPKVGMTAKSITTKGKAKNLVGEITWMGDTQYGYTVKIGSIFVAMDRIMVEVNGEWKFPAHRTKVGSWYTSDVPMPTSEFPCQ